MVCATQEMRTERDENDENEPLKSTACDRPEQHILP